MIWGRVTWNLFHTLMNKVQDNQMPLLRNEWWNLVQLICTNLPCPICANHATEYCSKVSFASLQTKQDWIQFFYTFHNDVNARKNIPLYPYSSLDLYDKMNTNQVIQQFFIHFRDHSMMLSKQSSEMIRRLLLRQLKSWLQKTRHLFND